MKNLINAITRANSHLRYWRYRRDLNNGGPSLRSAVREWSRRLMFELRVNKEHRL